MTTIAKFEARREKSRHFTDYGAEKETWEVWCIYTDGSAQRLRWNLPTLYDAEVERQKLETDNA